MTTAPIGHHLLIEPEPLSFALITVPVRNGIIPVQACSGGLISGEHNTTAARRTPHSNTQCPYPSGLLYRVRQRCSGRRRVVLRPHPL
jgi:hypothetical protein